MEYPKISVIVTAHNRKKYLPYALQSLEKQTLDKDKFEVIVIKNFEDQLSDKIIERNNWKNIVIEENNTLGEKLSLGIDESKGDIITFLEDDDMYKPERLMYIYKSFQKIKNLIYISNDVDVIDENNNIIDKKFFAIKPSFNIIMKSDDPRWEKIIAKYEIYSNNSSIAVNRNIAENIKGLKGGMIDLAIMAISSFSEGLLFYTSKRLTYYRVHINKNVLKNQNSYEQLYNTNTSFTFLANYQSFQTDISFFKKFQSNCEKSSNVFCEKLAFDYLANIRALNLDSKQLKLPISQWRLLKFSLLGSILSNTSLFNMFINLATLSFFVFNKNLPSRLSLFITNIKDKINKYLDDEDKLILYTIKKNRGIMDINEIMIKTNINKNKLNRKLSKLIDLGYLEKVSFLKAEVYKIKSS
ncbi:glycosyl transferase [Caldisphaera lagunensis DSM 15908]|uniref:Glycosyl transferase n=1 Tax=Caldisphaera lagunensis (strain DSM 15908 / JCM 11604 / ANMR 0165 / IC-154) TaxID=1056495 RepID=L0AB90_CALLD|nr:glycosyltransferase family A protein [Caldisphaera lagunensis]AFZ70684.1 glycosyl transferase [Caldisphaera lagunensis DSM 15908]